MTPKRRPAASRAWSARAWRSRSAGARSRCAPTASACTPTPRAPPRSPAPWPARCGPRASSPSEKEPAMARHEVLAPVPGTFYRRPDPESEAFVEEGGEVFPGATIGLVEIMKNFQDVECEVAGTVVQFLVGNEEAVQAGQAVAVVDDGATPQPGGRANGKT